MARRSMSAGFGDQGLSGRYRGKLVQTKDSDWRCTYA